MAIKKEKNKHLTDDQRLALEAALRERKSLSHTMGSDPIVVRCHAAVLSYSFSF